uniref:Axin interactor, dorsalization associated n=1 Tax=Anolis carolinensis TaxID=28377 RepID=A0A803TBF9_ANOCA
METVIFTCIMFLKSALCVCMPEWNVREKFVSLCVFYQDCSSALDDGILFSCKIKCDHNLILQLPDFALQIVFHCLDHLCHRSQVTAWLLNCAVIRVQNRKPLSLYMLTPCLCLFSLAVLKNIFTYNKEFPFDVQPVPPRRILAPGEEEDLEYEEDEEEGGAGAGSPDTFSARVPGTLLPQLPSEPGMTLLTIKIEKIGLKDAGQCIDPYITVSVKDLNGIDLTPVQDTPVASRKEDTYIHFCVDIEIQRHIEKLTKGAAIFFEFKHYKPKKRFTSTKCFAFMEMDEIKPGPIVIELYKKPTDFKRKKLQLLTKKPLYLHLHQTLHKE